MNAQAVLHCPACGAEQPIGPAFAACARCGGPLEVAFDLTALARRDPAAWLRGQPHTVWGYADLLPSLSGAEPVTLGEGDTALLPAAGLSARLDRRVYWKNETVNPTWSHKDRFHTVAATMGRAMGFRTAAGSSTGNHGVSAAAYAAAAGMRSLILYPPETPVAFLHLTGMYGGQAAVTGWQARTAMLEDAVARHGLYRVDGRNPFGVEGYKTIAWELVRDLGGQAPDAVAVPVGSGRLIAGIWKGFRELGDLGWLDRLPRIAACQPTAADVLSEPLHRGGAMPAINLEAYSFALSTRERTVDPRVLALVRESGGEVVPVCERRLVATVRALAAEGLAVEPASAVAPAAVEPLCASGVVPPGGVVVAILTSAVTKSPDFMPELSRRMPWRVGVTPEELEELLQDSDLV